MAIYIKLGVISIYLKNDIAICNTFNCNQFFNLKNDIQLH